MRDRFARYVAALADSARRHGITGVPLMINIHGTEGGNGVPFAIGVSQLFESYAGLDGFVAGSDHYLGDMSLSTTVRHPLRQRRHGRGELAPTSR